MDRLFHEFNKRPMRQTPDELAENLMPMEHERRMTKRDKARRAFVNDFNRKQKQKRGVKNIAEAERERFLDMRE